MNESERWSKMNRVYFVILGLIIFFAYMDTIQIISFFEINTEQGWELYNTYTGPAIWSMWYVVILAIAIIWYIVSKDKSEFLGLLGAGWTLLFFGSQDLFYFLFSGRSMTDNMCWFDAMLPIRLISNILGESCPTSLSFMISALLGFVISYFLFNKLKKADW
jgi:Mg2+/citrate symporter